MVPKNTTRKTQRRTITFILLAGLILIIVSFFKTEFKNSFYFISEPIQRPLWLAGGVIAKIKSFANTEVLLQENEKLNAENRRLLSELTANANIQHENETLRKALNIGLEKEFALVLTEAFSAGLSSDVLILNKGFGDGIKGGMAVISADKVLVGFVQEVYNSYSKALLLSHPESSVNVKLASGESETVGVATGQGGGKMLLDLIPRDKPLSEGDLIVTRSFAQSYPEGLLIGFTGKLQTSDVSPFQQAEIDSIAGTALPEELFIIVNF